MKKLPALLLLGMLFLNLSRAENTVSVIDKLREDDWVCSFFNDVLNTQNRDTYYKYAPYYLENPEYEEDLTGERYPWYEGIWHPNFISISKGCKSLWIASHDYDIKKLSGNKVYIEISKERMLDNLDADKYVDLNWKLLNNKKKFTLIFEFDGDYVDIYVNNKKNFFATFCKYDITTYNQLKDLIKTNKCEPWMIEYPKRADGSIDYVSGTEHTGGHTMKKLASFPKI